MKADDFRKLSDEELAQREQDLSEEYFNLRFQFFTGQLENTARMRGVRKDIARAKTLRRQRAQGHDAAVSEG